MTRKVIMDTQDQITNSLFQPDILIMERFLETTRKKSHLKPEKDLMLAVLEDAVDCYLKNIFAKTEKEKALFRDAEDWILEENSRRFFSFENICEILNINPQYLREGLINWKQRELKDYPRLNTRYRRYPKPSANRSFLKSSAKGEEKVFTKGLRG